MKDKVLRWCREQRLFPSGGPVTVALSGGADSVAMLHLLLSLRDPLGITVCAAHFNHHLRGDESRRDEDFCRDLCARLQVPLRCGGGDVAAWAAKTGQGVEASARELRYGFLLEDGGTVATAHNADDNLETLLLHLIRGTALRGLCGIPPRRGSIVRPVLCLTRQEILAYLREQDLAYVTDSTNNTDFCLRNRLRHHVIPTLLPENPGLPERALDTARLLREDEALLQQQADALLDRARRGNGWSAAVLAAAPRPLALRALWRLAEDAGGTQLSAAHLEATLRLLHGEPAASVDLPGLKLRRQYDLLLCGEAPVPAFSPVRLPLPGSCPLPGGRRMVCRGPLPYAGQPGLFLVLSQPPVVRPRAAGDCLRLPGGSKSLRALMIDRKIPAALRSGVPVIECGGRIAAVWGVGSDPAFRPAAGQLCYQIDVVPEKERENV